MNKRKQNTARLPRTARAVAAPHTSPAATEQTREYARIFEPSTSNLARRRILRCRLSIAYTSNGRGQLSAVQGLGNRARGANQIFEELGLKRLASMSIRRRSVWIARLSRTEGAGTGTVRLIGREFRALATLLHRSGIRTRPPHPRVRAAAGADRDPAPARLRGREQTAWAGPALRDLSLVAARHARKLDAACSARGSSSTGRRLTLRLLRTWERLLSRTRRLKACISMRLVKRSSGTRLIHWR
jgi:hypothetical protein